MWKSCEFFKQIWIGIIFFIWFQLSTAKQSLTLLKQDKDYLSRQLSESGNRSSFNEEKVQQLSRQLEDAKQAREDMYEKYVASR